MIIDPKADDKLATLKPRVDVLPHPQRIFDAWTKGYRYVGIIDHGAMDPIYTDRLLFYLYQKFSNFGVYIDELYYIHRQGRAGSGLQAILTRGRSDNITFFGCTQRPSWISLFCLSEADYLGQFKLTLEKDRKTMYSIIGNKRVLVNPDKPYEWFYYDNTSDRLHYFNAQ
ncbi:MAG: hypothetical protein ACREVA_03540 [Burkholderiales bacterium]